MLRDRFGDVVAASVRQHFRRERDVEIENRHRLFCFVQRRNATRAPSLIAKAPQNIAGGWQHVSDDQNSHGGERHGVSLSWGNHFYGSAAMLGVDPCGGGQEE